MHAVGAAGKAFSLQQWHDLTRDMILHTKTWHIAMQRALPWPNLAQLYLL